LFFLVPCSSPQGGFGPLGDNPTSTWKFAQNEQISRPQQENVNAITGGDSFAYVGFQIFGMDGKAVNAHSMPNDLLLVPIFIHKGKYPLYDVNVRFADIEGPMELNFAANAYRIGNMAPELGSMSEIRLPHHGKNIAFNIFFSGRDGLWTQLLRMLWVGEGWASANKVMRGFQEIYRDVSANFPRQKDGSIEWEKTNSKAVVQ
jgi:hypothetical protein